LFDLSLDDFCPFKAGDEPLPDKGIGQVIGPERMDHYRPTFFLDGNRRIGHFVPDRRISLEVQGSSGQKQLPHPARVWQIGPDNFAPQPAYQSETIRPLQKCGFIHSLQNLRWFDPLNFWRFALFLDFASLFHYFYD
jgi:hypothetical protein